MDGSSAIELNHRLVKQLLYEFPQETSFCLVSNQSGIGRNLIETQDVLIFNQRLYDRLDANGVNLTLSIFCPHAPLSGCSCRKPSPLMLNLVKDLHSNLAEKPCIYFGDSLTDEMASKSSKFEFRKVIDFDG
jgi:D-glycero-D-manno-heptose 1,7-bisphosphate phosphatase